MKEKENSRPIIGISTGDLNGIGLEVVLKTFADSRMYNLCTPILYGSNRSVSYYKKSLNLDQVSSQSLKTPERANPKTLNVINCWEEEVPIEPGKATEIAGQYAFKALEYAANDLKEGRIQALITAPLSKETVQKTEKEFKGHTGYLQHIAGADDCLMMLISENLNVGLVTTHVPIKDLASKITKSRIEGKINIMSDTLRRDLGISKPKIAVLGLNPHAGENGLLGKEEIEHISPAVAAAVDKGLLVYGPFPADGFFGSGAYLNYDGILAMYHDQGLIPFKLSAFDEGVNYTAGLKVIRTSPDHGTAFSIANKNKADPSSFRNAVFMALDIIRQRKRFDTDRSEPLKPVKMEMEEEK